MNEDRIIEEHSVFAGKTIGHYQLLTLIGEGGMGGVYKAHDTRLQREVAVKILSPQLVRDEENIKRFYREAQAAAQLVHPNVITIHDVGEENNVYYIVMEFLRGESLRELLRKRSTLEVGQAVDIAIQVCQALEVAHEQGVLHRDIKSDNLMILPDGTVKVLDFGIARMMTSQSLTKTGDMLGTVEYMAPEQILGEEVDHRSDIYSAGVVLYEMLTGELPFTGSSPANIVYRQLEESPAPPGDINSFVPMVLERIVLKTLLKNPEDRFQSVTHLKHALQKHLQRTGGAHQTGEEETGEGEDEWLIQRTPRNVFQARLIGREKEMTILRRHVDHLKENQGKTLFVAGEAGIGKTRLIEEIEKYANRKGMLILKGHCLYQEGLEPFTPFVEAVNEFFQVKKDPPSTRRARIKDFIRQEAPELMALSQRFITTIGFSVDEAEDEDSNGYDGGNKTRLFEVLSQLLQLISEKEQLLLFLEDIHWADSASLQLLHYVSRNSRNLPLLIVSTYRPEDVNPGPEGKLHPLTDTMQRMNREGLFEKIDLERLSQIDHSKLMKSLFRRIDFSRDFQDLLYKETKGNPFFLIETLKLLQERNIVGPEKGIWRELKTVSRMDIPERVYDVIRSRVERLDEDQREMLQFAAVVGERFSSHILAHGLQMKKIHLLKILHRLERVHQVIFSDGSMYVFHHPKIREVLYDEIQDELRVEYHRMIGDFLEDEHNDNLHLVLNDLAHHFYHGQYYEKAVPYLVQVGDRATKLYAHKEACEHYERALASLESADTISDMNSTRRKVLLKAGISYDELGKWEEALEKFKMLLAMSERDGAVKDQAEALRQMGRTYYGKRELDKALDFYLESLEYYEEIEDWKKICKVYNNIGILFYEKGDLNESVLKYNKALEFAERIQDKREIANIYTNLGIMHNVKGKWDKALSYYHRCIPLYEQTDDKQGLARVCHNMGMTYADQQAWQISDSYYEQCLGLCEDLKDIVLLSLTHLNRTEVLLNISDLSEAKESCVMALAYFEKLDDQLGVADAYRFLGVISKREKDWETAQAHFEESIRLNDHLENPLGLAEVYREYGRLHEERGEVEEALTKLRKSEDLFRRLGATEDAKEIHQKISQLEMELDAGEKEMNAQLTLD